MTSYEEGDEPASVSRTGVNPVPTVIVRMEEDSIAVKTVMDFRHQKTFQSDLPEEGRSLFAFGEFGPVRRKG